MVAPMKMFRSMKPPAPEIDSRAWAQTAGSFNHYICQVCRRTTITQHRDAGTTSFRLGCRATRGCHGMGLSQLYRVSQDPSQAPHARWWRASTQDELDAYIALLPESEQQWARTHHARGACLIMETERSARVSGGAH
jgi:hypothetical protein